MSKWILFLNALVKNFLLSSFAATYSLFSLFNKDYIVLQKRQNSLKFEQSMLNTD